MFDDVGKCPTSNVIGSLNIHHDDGLSPVNTPRTPTVYSPVLYITYANTYIHGIMQAIYSSESLFLLL